MEFDSDNTNFSLLTDKQTLQKNIIEGKHGHERYGEDGIVFHKDTIILISSMIIMIVVGKFFDKYFSQRELISK